MPDSLLPVLFLVTDAALKPDPSRRDRNRGGNRFEAHCLPQISLLLLSAPLREGRERSQVCLFVPVFFEAEEDHGRDGGNP